MIMDRLIELGAIGSLSNSEKAEIEKLYFDVLDKKFVRTSCSDCYHDAVIEMIVYLKRHGKMKEKSNYALKNGVLLQMSFGSSEMYTNSNLTDEVAESYLAKYPENIKLFSKAPDDWQDRIKNKDSEYDLELLNYMVEAVEDGASDESIMESFADFKLNGKKITKKRLTVHLAKAKELATPPSPTQDPEKEEISDDQEEQEEETTEE